MWDEDESWDGDDYKKEPRGEADEEDILRFASASPTDETVEENPIHIKVITFEPSVVEKPLCDSVTHRIFEEFDLASFDADTLSVWELDWQILDEEDLGLSEQNRECKYEPSYIARVQKALIETFERMRRFGTDNEEHLLEAVRDSLSYDPTHDISEWERHSTGASLFIHQEINYEGGNEMPLDGFSIVSEGRFFQPFDKE